MDLREQMVRELMRKQTPDQHPFTSALNNGFPVPEQFPASPGVVPGTQDNNEFNPNDPQAAYMRMLALSMARR